VFCKYCGAQLATDAVFCVQCGQNLKTGEQLQKPTEPHQQVGKDNPLAKANKWSKVGCLIMFLLGLVFYTIWSLQYDATKGNPDWQSGRDAAKLSVECGAKLSINGQVQGYDSALNQSLELCKDRPPKDVEAYKKGFKYGWDLY
jgi:hypothetical protein